MTKQHGPHDTGHGPRHYESAQEEFQRRVRELYALADKMGLRLAITVKSKSPQEQFAAAGKKQRQPGEN